jgi:hypothetical protein
MSKLNMYLEYFANWVSAGKLILRDRISSVGIKPAQDRIFTKKYVTKVWNVVSYPIDFQYNLGMLVREEMFNSLPAVKTMVFSINAPSPVNVDSDTYKRQLRLSNNQHERYKEYFESLTKEDRLLGKTVRMENGRKFTIREEDMLRHKGKANSYTYVYEHTKRGGQFFKSYMFIQASAPTNADMEKYRNSLASLLDSLGVIFYEAQGGMSSYLTNFGPASYIQEETKKFYSTLMSDENLTHLMPYKTQGLHL